MDSARGMLIGCIITVLTLAAFGAFDPVPAGPRLIGHWCAGAGGDIWASDESDFPTPCQSIERWPS